MAPHIDCRPLAHLVVDPSCRAVLHTDLGFKLELVAGLEAVLRYNEPSMLARKAASGTWSCSCSRHFAYSPAALCLS